MLNMFPVSVTKVEWEFFHAACQAANVAPTRKLDVAHQDVGDLASYIASLELLQDANTTVARANKGLRASRFVHLGIAIHCELELYFQLSSHLSGEKILCRTQGGSVLLVYVASCETWVTDCRALCSQTLTTDLRKVGNGIYAILKMARLDSLIAQYRTTQLADGTFFIRD